jgi:hypothetical protein
MKTKQSKTLIEMAAAMRRRANEQKRETERQGSGEVVKPKIAQPTPEQHDAFRLVDVTDKKGATDIRIGKAYRRVVQIVALHGQHILDEAQFKALFHYRHHAILADRSPLKDSLNKSPGGGDGSPTVEILNACRVRDDCERAAGALVDILRAVAVDDLSLAQWAIHQGGAIEKREVRKGKPVSYLRPRGKFLHIAQLEITMAAIRVKNELDAGNLSFHPFVRPVSMAA